MFGLEKDKSGKKKDSFVFDLERELKDVKKQKEVLEKIAARLQQIKGILRSGAKEEDYHLWGDLLHGYSSLIKVVSRVHK